MVAHPAADLAAAQLRGNTHFFVFGHKPAYTADYLGANKTPAAGMDTSPALIDLRNKFWDVIEQYGALYFCGHEHVYNVMQPRGSAYQLLVGSGGSPFDAKITDTTLTPVDRYYAWATVNVYASGKVVVNGYGFDANYGPTQVLTTLTLSH